MYRQFNHNKYLDQIYVSIIIIIIKELIYIVLFPYAQGTLQQSIIKVLKCLKMLQIWVLTSLSTRKYRSYHDS